MTTDKPIDVDSLSPSFSHSEGLVELSAALCAAQGKMPRVAFDATNPFLHNKYASLGAVIEASRPILSENGLAICQLPFSQNGAIGVESVLMHKSGEWISQSLSLDLGDEKGKSRAQVAGSIITYLRRYAWASILGLYADEDTDGHDQGSKTPANKPTSKPASTKTSPKPEGVSGQGGSDQNASEGKLGPKSATERSRNWMIDKLNATKEDADTESRVFVTEFFVKADCLLPTESIEQLPLQFVPTTQDELHKLAEAIHAFGNGEPAQMPYKHPMVHEAPKTEIGKSNADEAEKAINPDWLVVEGIIDYVNTKTGQNRNGPWTCYGIKMHEIWYSTFSNRIGEFAQQAQNTKAEVTIYYTEKDNRRTVEEIT